jgi:hypothetical protein
MSRLERIVRTWGGELAEGGRRAFIPGPGHSPHDRSVSLLEGDDGRIIIYCFSQRDDWREVRRALQAAGLLSEAECAPGQPRPQAPPPTTSSRREALARVQKIWAQARPAAASLAARYLEGRAIETAIASASCLRFHPGMTSLEDRKRRPALISAISGEDGAMQGVEITLLAADGRTKAALRTPRRVIGKMLGGAIRLQNATDALLIGEGMETTASACAALDLPGWALMSAHNMARFAPPSAIARLVVASDNDAAGAAAFERLRRRLAPNLEIERATPPAGFNDWNDWAQAKRAT